MSLGALEAIAEAQHAAEAGTDARGVPLRSVQAKDSAPIGASSQILTRGMPPKWGNLPLCSMSLSVPNTAPLEMSPLPAL